MAAQQYPELDFPSAGPTRDALHAYARVLGDWLKSCRPKRKHWWHASLRPSLTGLTTGVVDTGINFELALDLRKNLLVCRTAEGARTTDALDGQPATELAAKISDFLTAAGVDSDQVPPADSYGTDGFSGYSTEHANRLGGVLNSVRAAMVEFRSGIKEETSPIQLWPHHFDLSMLWLPGDKIEGQDPENEEYSDKQMNFGFASGDEGIPEPYFYVTAYPLPADFAGLELPAGTEWKTDGFSGAVLLYRTLRQNSDPGGYLLSLWTGLLAAGRSRL